MLFLYIFNDVLLKYYSWPAVVCFKSLPNSRKLKWPYILTFWSPPFTLGESEKTPWFSSVTGNPAVLALAPLIDHFSGVLSILPPIK